MLKDEWLRRSLALICLGSGILLLLVQWRTIEPIANTRLDLEKNGENTSNSSALNRKSLNRYSLVVDLSDRRVYVYRRTQLQASYPVAIGQPGWETPTGSFQVTDMKKHPPWRHPITGAVVASGADNPLGSRWIGFGREGRYQIGFHGTPQANLVGQAVSHGCLRMRNSDIQVLYERVSLGTPVTVQF